MFLSCYLSLMSYPVLHTQSPQLSGLRSWTSPLRVLRRLSQCWSAGCRRQKRDTRTGSRISPISSAANRPKSASDEPHSHRRHSKFWIISLKEILIHQVSKNWLYVLASIYICRWEFKRGIYSREFNVCGRTVVLNLGKMFVGENVH